MLIKYKDAAYNNKIEDLRSNGYTVNFVELDYEDFTLDEESLVQFAEFQLPNGGKSYKDYSAIVAWSDYLENEDNPDVPTDFDRTHSGMPIPIAFTAQNNGSPVTCTYTLEDTETEGVVRITLAVTGTTTFTDISFKDYIDNLRGLMFIKGDEHNLEPDTSLVVPNLEAFFKQASGMKSFTLNLAGKEKLLSLGDDESYSALSVYSVTSNSLTMPSSINETKNIVFELPDNKEFQCDENCVVCSSLIYKCSELKTIGFSSIKDIETLEESNITLLRFIAQNNDLVFKKSVTEASPGCLYLRRNVIYPISSSLSLKSDIHICGNGSTIMAYATGVNEDNTIERKDMVIIDNYDFDDHVTNVTFENLTFRGTFPFRDATGSPIPHSSSTPNILPIEAGYKGDICIKTDSGKPMLKNLKFEKVTFTGFKYAAHTVSEKKVLPVESSDWLFNNCEFNNVETGFMLTWIRGITITNSHIDNSACKGDKHHCVYIARGCSYITVDNCLLENSIGAGIDVSEAAKVEESKKMHHCAFTNLQIRNCCIGVNISSPSENIIVKNIFVTNVARALRLANCTKVAVDNFNASGSFYFEYIRPGEEGEEDTRWTNEASEWVAVAIQGYVEATISNSFFSTGGKLFGSSKSGFIPDSWERVNVDVKFDNCVFVTTLSEYVKKVNNDNGTQEISYSPVRSTLGVPTKYSENSKIYLYNVEFEKCQFFMNSENYNEPMIYLYGFKNDSSQNDSSQNDPDNVSTYSFNNCLVAYRSGNGNPNDDIFNGYDENGDPAVFMPKSYFIHPDVGTHASITNCSFYNSRDIVEDNYNYGFVKESLVKYCTIENNDYSIESNFVNKKAVNDSDQTN